MSTPVLSEEQGWIQQALTGNANAFGNIVKAYQGPVYNLCYRMLGSPEEAEDATQDAFVRAYTNLHRYDPERRLLNWLLSIASHHCIDLLRRRRISWLSLESETLAERISVGDEGLQRRVERRESAEQMQRWLNQLDPGYRTPLILLYWYDLSYEEIADVLSLSVPAVKSRLHRARHQMADLMQAESARQTTPPLASALANG